MFFSVQVLICQVTCYIAEDQLFQWTEKVGYIINQMNICSRFWCDNVHFNMSWQWIQSFLAGWLYSLVWCRFLTVCSTDNWTSLCCQTVLWLNTRLQTICTLALLPSYVLFIAALTMESLSALHWSSLIYSRAFQLLVIIVHVRISLMHKSKLALWHALCVIFLVLSHCEVHRIPAVVYQCYSDVLGTDSVTMETYNPVLTSLGKCIQVSSF